MNKLLLTLIFGIFLLSFVSSALTIDTITNYDKTFLNYPEITLKDWFGLPLIGEEIFKGTIESHTQSCSSDCSSTIKVLVKEGLPYYDGIKFYKINDGQRTEKEIYSYKVEKRINKDIVKIPILETTCKFEGTYPNGTAIEKCTTAQTGTRDEQQYGWEELSTSDTSKGEEAYIRISGAKKPTDEIDWVLTSNGESLDAWADWGYAIIEKKEWWITSTSLANFNNSQWESEGFTASATYNVNIISMSINATTSGNYIINVSLFSSDATQSPLLILDTNSTIISLTSASSGADGSGGWYNFTMPKSTSIIKGVNYSIVIRSNSTLTSPETTKVRRSGTEFPNGTVYYTTNAGANWFSDTSDLDFEIWSNTSVGSSITLNSPPNNNISISYSNIFNISATPTVPATLVNISYWDNSSGTWSIKETQSITGTTGSKIFTRTLPNGYYLWSGSACDSDGDCGVSSENRTIGIVNFLEDSTTYNAIAYETSTEDFYENITYNSNTTSIIVKLNYDGTNYSTTNLGSGDNGYFKASLDIPIINITANKTFYWIINEVKQQYYNQTIKPIILVNCNGTYSVRALNFTFFDETSLLQLNTTASPTNFKGTFDYWIGSGVIKKSYSFQRLLNESNTYSFCIEPNNSGTNIIKSDLNLEFGATGYNDNGYAFLSNSLTNNTQKISLYLLPTASGTKFFHTVRRSIDTVPNVLVNIEKYFVGLGIWNTIGIRTSDIDGKFVEYLELDKQYRYTIKDGNETLGIIEKNAICTAFPCEVILQITTESTSLLDEIESYIAQNVLTNLTINRTSKIVTLTFDDLTGTAQYWRFWVYKPYFNNETIETICNQTMYTTNGVMTCDTSNYMGDIVARAYISRSPEKITTFLTWVNDTLSPALSTSGLLASIIILLVIVFTATRSPTTALIMIPFGLIILKFIGFLPLGWGTIVGLIVADVIIMYKIG